MSLAVFLLMALGATTFFAIGDAPNSDAENATSVLPVYLNVIDPSGTFSAKIVSGDKCIGAKTKYDNVSGFKFLGCADNTTRFGLFQNDKNIAREGTLAVKGFTFPLKGYEQAEMSMNRFCGREITKDYNVFMSIKEGPLGIDSWVITLRIENLKK